jgi:DNA primase
MSEYNPTSERIIEILTGLGKGKPRKAGGDNVVLRCPFHDDNDPSFCMNVSNGLFICYGCDVTGNFRKFLTMLGYAPDYINLHYGATLKNLSANAPAPKDLARPEVVMEVNRRIDNDLLGLFHHCPEALLEEGFSMETLRQFGIGVDKHHHRITFPLRDIEGHLVGISGRAMLIDQEPRYKVYKEEYKTWGLPPYETDKSNLLWNAHTMFHRLLTENGRPRIVIVEGFKAVMWLTQAGIPNVVGLMTKRMSKTQEWILQRMGGEFVLMLDNDNAGVQGTIKVTDTFYRSGAPLRVVLYDGKQPTDVPLDELQEVVNSAPMYSELMYG